MIRENYKPYKGNVGSALPTFPFRNSIVSRLSIVVCAAVWISTTGSANSQFSGPKPNSAAPELRLRQLLQAPEGAAPDWPSLRGRVVVLEFWATWCAPCISALPHLNQLADKFKDKPVQFISITDEDSEVVAAFLKRRPIKGWVGIDLNRSSRDAFQAEFIPRTVVVDKLGRIAAITRPDLLTEELINTVAEGRQPDLVRFQIAEDPARFNLTIRPAKSTSTSAEVSPGRFTCRNMSLKRALSLIHNISETRIICPLLLQDARYDISAAVTADKSGALNGLVSKAIETSFNLKVRRETREVDVLVMTAPKGLAGGLKPASAAKPKYSLADDAMIATGQQIDLLADRIEKVMNVPVLNETGLAGRYDWEIVYDSKQANSIVEVARKELDLELKASRRRIEILVVEMERE
ncbi:MAG: TIGR03435 family protein [Acidobacteriota bacterium]